MAHGASNRRMGLVTQRVTDTNTTKRCTPTAYSPFVPHSLPAAGELNRCVACAQLVGSLTSLLHMIDVSQKENTTPTSRRIVDYVLLFLVAGISGALPQVFENKSILTDLQAHLAGWAILICGVWLLKRCRKWKSLFGP
jgi:hypothetical protein